MLPNSLNKARKEIDILDDKIVDLVIQRFLHVITIGEIKKESGSQIVCTSREAQVLASVIESAEHHLNKVGIVEKEDIDLLVNQVVNIYKQLMDASVKLQGEKWIF